MKVSLCVHSFNEADALRRLLQSGLGLGALCDEWVVLDHQSTDHTQVVLDQMRCPLRRAGINLVTAYEPRDLSATHTFADVRNAALNLCHHPVVALLDADFILGPSFANFVQRAKVKLENPRLHYHCATYAVPCVWDTLHTDAHCAITKHGRVWVHNRRPRILWWPAVHYEQVGDGGRWEYLILDDPARPRKYHLTPLGTAQQKVAVNTVVSCNVKPAERIALRNTMTMFMQDAISGGQAGTWLENYAAGTVRDQPPYPYHHVNLRGWRLNLARLSLEGVADESVARAS
jgi:hypothetical protein